MENYGTGLYGKHLWNAWDWYSFLKTTGVEERILALPPISWVTLGTLLNLSGPPFFKRMVIPKPIRLL